MQVDHRDALGAIADAGLQDNQLRPDYSGRAMYGADCLGFVYDDLGEVFEFVAALSAIVEDDSWSTTARQDSMGRSSIVYWPGVQVINITEEDEEV